MEFSGYIADGAGRRMRGSFGILSASGEVLAGPTDTDGQGNYLLNASQGENVFFSAPGHVTKVLAVPFREIIIELNKPFPMLTVAAVLTAAYIVMSGKKVSGKLGAFNFGIDDVKTVFYILGGVLALDTITKILRSLGFWKDPGSSHLDNIAADPNSYWNVNYWKKTQVYSYAIDTATAKNFAEQIHDALGYFNDDESAIISVFHQLRTRANISYVAYVFNELYNKDLFTTLRGGNWPEDGISEADLLSITNYGDTLPAF